MPIVYVHGVDNRPGRAYANGVAVRRKFLDEHIAPLQIDGSVIGPCLDAKTSFPLWGDHGAAFRWDMASLPQLSKKESLGTAEEMDMAAVLATWASIAPRTMDDHESLLLLAQESFPDAIQIINAAVIDSATDAEAAAEFVAAASKYAAEHPERPPWMDGLKTDIGFLNELLEHVPLPAPPAGESLGMIGDVAAVVVGAANRVKAAARDFVGAAGGRLGDMISTRLLAAHRAGLNARVGRFVGDAFCYFGGRGVPGEEGPIPQAIGDAIERARTEAGPLVVVAHSLGGVITFELLATFRPHLQADLLVSVGSQISWFEELKLFHASNIAIPNDHTAKAKRPSNIRRWLNVYDLVDILSFACDPVFEAVQDLEYDTRTHIVRAHNAYFEQDRFYQALSAWIPKL
jgi:hypothetical protein